jgi:hypothetical protein
VFRTFAPVRRNRPISVNELRPPQPVFGWCSTMGMADCGSRTSRQTSPLGLSYRVLAVMFVTRQRPPRGHWRLGCLAGGPFLLPGIPLMFDGSCR